MAQYVASITIDDVIVALAAFLTPFMGGGKVIRGQQNRVPAPLLGYAKLTELNVGDLGTPVDMSDPNNAQMLLIGPAQIDVQVDFYGASSGDQCKAFKGVYRSQYAAAQFPDGIKPLFCSDGHQSPLVTGEEQYETRWTLTASLQYNPSVALPQQTANVLAMKVIQEI